MSIFKQQASSFSTNKINQKARQTKGIVSFLLFPVLQKCPYKNMSPLLLEVSWDIFTEKLITDIFTSDRDLNCSEPWLPELEQGSNLFQDNPISWPSQQKVSLAFSIILSHEQHSLVTPVIFWYCLQHMNCGMKQSCLNGQQKAALENNLCEIQEQQTYTKYNQSVRK